MTAFTFSPDDRAIRCDECSSVGQAETMDEARAWVEEHVCVHQAEMCGAVRHILETDLGKACPACIERSRIVWALQLLHERADGCMHLIPEPLRSEATVRFAQMLFGRMAQVVAGGGHWKQLDDTRAKA